MGARAHLRMVVAVLAVAARASAASLPAPPADGSQHVRLRVGVYEFAPLVSLGIAGQPQGLYVDLLEHAAREEGWELEYVPGTWDQCLRELSEGTVDLVPVVGISEERARRFAFNAEVPVLDWGVVFKRSDAEIETIFDLRGKRIGVLKGSIYTQGFRSLLAQFGIAAELVERDDYRQIFQGLQRRELDAGINAQLSGAAIASDYGLEATHILFSPIRLAYAAPKGKAGVLKALDRHFAALKAQPDSAWSDAFARWLPTRLAAKSPRWLTPLLAAAAVILSLSIAFTWALRRQVAARTADLQIVNAQLRDREALLRNFSDAIPEPIFVKDREGRYLFANPAVAELIGRRPDEVVGRTDLELHGDPQVAREVMATDRRIMARGEAEVVEQVLQTPAGRRICSSTKAPYRDAHGTVAGIVGSSRDITAHRATEERLRQSHKMESIGRLAGGIAHDFNNLLTVILSCAAALQESAEAGAPACLEDVIEIRSAGSRAADLTRQLLAFARKQVIAAVPLELNAVVRRSEQLLRRVLGEDVDLVVDLAPEPWTVRCDRGQLEQVILNLVVNARDSMPRGGRVTVATANVAAAEAERAGRPGEWVLLTIRDTGCGIAAEVRDHLFEPFFTTKKVGQGTGLGLAMVYGIVKQSLGHIDVDSRSGEGAVFSVWLPRWHGAPEVDAPPPTPAVVGGDEPVLVVEDDPHVREVTVRSLRSGGYDVHAVQNGAEALALEAGVLARMRLLVTDVVMPGMDGHSLATELLRRHPPLRVLFVSGYSNDVTSGRGVLPAGAELLQKPFTAPELLARVRAALDAR